MKKLISVLIVVIMIAMTIGIMTASAGVSISGPSSVSAGGTYTYDITVSATASSIGGKVSCGGIFSGSSATFWKDSSSGMNESISASCSITVKVAAGAQPGDKGTIKVSGEGSKVDPDSFEVSTFGISDSKSATVPSASEPTPKRTRDPNATPRPTKEPEGWEVVAIDVDAAEGGTTVEVSMEGEGDTKIPESLLATLVEKKTPLVVDFGGYKVTVDPETLTAFEGIKSLDLGLAFDKDEALSAVADGADVYQLHFAHEGQLPGKFTYTFKAEGSQPGDLLYLYYYYGVADVIEGKQEAIVDENGWVTFDIYHCSSYFVSDQIIEKAITNFLEVEEDPEPVVTPEPTHEPTVEPTPEPTVEPTPEPTPEPAPKTEEPPAPQGISIAGFIAALAGAVLLTILLTMLATRSGMFKRSAQAQQAKADKRQAKIDKNNAKETAKQAAADQKHASKAQKIADKQARKEKKDE